jgi:hypothetical protein
MQEKLKTQQYKDQFDAQNKEVTDAIHKLYEDQQQNLSPAFHMVRTLPIIHPISLHIALLFYITHNKYFIFYISRSFMGFRIVPATPYANLPYL